MPTIVTDAGFAADDWTAPVLPLEALTEGAEAPEGPLAVDLANDADPAVLKPWLDRLAMVRVAFPAFADGRGLSIARRLRSMGYAGRLRAAGPLISDQYRAARRVGFDEVELPDEMAQRQPADTWRTDASLSYQDRLRG